MKTILNNYLSLIKFFKFASLNDAQYKYILKNISNFEDDLNIDMPENEAASLGVSFPTKFEAFMFADPEESESDINKTYQTFKGYSLGKNSGRSKNIEELLPPSFNEALNSYINLYFFLVDDENGNGLDWYIDYIESNELLAGEKNVQNLYKLRMLLINSNKMLDFVQVLYEGGVEIRNIEKILILYQNKDKQNLLKYIISIFSLAKAQPLVNQVYLDALKSKMNIRHSDVFDYLKDKIPENIDNTEQEFESIEEPSYSSDEEFISGERETYRPIGESPTMPAIQMQDEIPTKPDQKISNAFYQVLLTLKKY